MNDQYDQWKSTLANLQAEYPIGMVGYCTPHRLNPPKPVGYSISPVHVTVTGHKPESNELFVQDALGDTYTLEPNHFYVRGLRRVPAPKIKTLLDADAVANLGRAIVKFFHWE